MDTASAFVPYPEVQYYKAQLWGDCLLAEWYHPGMVQRLGFLDRESAFEFDFPVLY